MQRVHCSTCKVAVPDARPVHSCKPRLSNAVAYSPRSSPVHPAVRAHADQHLTALRDVVLFPAAQAGEE